MSHESLHVTTAHLRELAAKHSQAAAEVTLATELVSGVSGAVRASHGVIAWSTAGAIEAIELARRAAGNSMARDSDAMGEKLTSAAGRYEAVDRDSGGRIDQQVRPGLTASASPPR